MIEVEPRGPLGDPEGRVPSDKTVDSVPQLLLYDDPVDEMVEDEVFSPPAPVLHHGLVVGHQQRHLSAHVGLVQALSLKLQHKLKENFHHLRKYSSYAVYKNPIYIIKVVFHFKCSTFLLVLEHHKQKMFSSLIYSVLKVH